MISTNAKNIKRKQLTIFYIIIPRKSSQFHESARLARLSIVEINLYSDFMRLQKRFYSCWHASCCSKFAETIKKYMTTWFNNFVVLRIIFEQLKYKISRFSDTKWLRTSNEKLYREMTIHGWLYSRDSR